MSFLFHPKKPRNRDQELELAKKLKPCQEFARSQLRRNLFDGSAHATG